MASGAEEDGGAEKPFEATPRKLEEARRRGEVPLSQDLVAAAVFLGILVAAIGLGTSTLTAGGASLMLFLDAPDRLAKAVFGGGGGAGARSLLVRIASDLAPWFVLPFVLALGAVVLQRALVFAPQKLAPKLSRISPISIAKQKFGRDGLFNFLKSFVKLVIFAALLALILARSAGEILATPAAGLTAAFSVAASVTGAFFAVSLGAMASLGGVDFLWQRAQHLRRQRMSLKEMRDEMRETEGDPHLKQARRQRGMDIATNRMLADVPTADVVVVNPTRFAVALRWDRSGAAAPVCVAKGSDEIAARIREAAIAAAVPIHRDPPTARALFSTVGLGEEIRVEHYPAVAAAIRFADAMRLKARGAR